MSVWAVARRPKWIAGLIFALIVAGVFAALGQWQLQRSIDDATVVERDTENAVSLESVATVQSVISSNASGRLVTVSCDAVSGDDVVLTQRSSPQGTGSWLIRHCKLSDGSSLAVALGWSKESINPASIAQPEGVLEGRYVPTESAQQSNYREGERSALAIPELVNLWQDPGPVYGGYLVLTVAPDGLVTIGTEAPPTSRQLNWLNLFYAAEWIIFAGFAVYLWYRLLKDEWLRELEEASSLAP
jgi:cytochrome oxidase assembly protein ShyY1